jgi:hypothetical protein
MQSLFENDGFQDPVEEALSHNLDEEFDWLNDWSANNPITRAPEMDSRPESEI